MSENKAAKVFGVLLVCVGLAFSYQCGFNKNNYVTQEELEQQFGGYDDLEEYLEEVFLRDLAEDLEDELYFYDRDISELKSRVRAIERVTTIIEWHRLNANTEIYEEMMGVVYRYINEEITLEQFNERFEELCEEWEEVN